MKNPHRRRKRRQNRACIEKQEEDKDLDKDPEVYLDYEVPAKKPKVRPLQYTSSEDSITSEESSTDEEQTDAPMAKEFVATEYGGPITNSGDAAITDGTAADTREVAFNDKSVKEIHQCESTVDSTLEASATVPCPKVETAVVETTLGETAVVVPIPSVQERAESILRYGLMPLCAPARRDWGKGGLLQVDIGGTSLTWPPIGWQKMNADQKLLAVEFAANSIEFQTTRTFPKLSRGTLLDKYNFFGLARDSEDKEERTGQSVT